ncbi:MAG: TetR/AcrR family transcriptional regulator [Myxococcota bacterium]
MAEPLSSREKILDVAESLFARRGFAAVGLREVAEVSGLSKSSLFHHFKNKDQLYAEVLIRVLSQIRDGFDHVLAQTLSPREQIERWLSELIDSLAEHPTVSRLLLRSLFEEEERETPEGKQAESLLASILMDAEKLVRKGIAAGDVRQVSAPHTLQTLIGAVVYHFASGEIGEGILGRPIFTAEEVARRKREVIGLLRHGLFTQVNAQPAG